MKSPSLKGNVLANLAGRVWSACLSILTVPVFLHILGTEAYGLVSLFASLQVVFAFFDLGLSATVNREMARNVATGRPAESNNDLLRTLEAVYWLIGIAIGATILWGSRWFVDNWLNLSRLPAAEAEMALAIMAFAFASRWPVSLYGGVLQGLQEQVLQNGIFVSAVSFRMLGGLAAIIWISPTVHAFLLVQGAGHVLEALACRHMAWRVLRRHGTSAARFRPGVLRSLWGFALSFNFIGVLGMIQSNADRLIISKYLPLEQLGYYAIASTAIGGLPLVSNAVVTAVFPRFSAHAAVDDTASLSASYHKAVQAITFSCAGISLAVGLFSYEILVVWTRSAQVAQQAWPALSLLSAAGFFIALFNPAYMLLVAKGFTRVPLAMNAVNVSLFVPVMILAVPRGGIEAAAAVWTLQNIVVFLVYSHFARTEGLKEKFRGFLSRDVVLYPAIGIAWFGGARLATLSVGNPIVTLAVVCAAFAGYTVSVLLATRRLSVFPSGSYRWPLPNRTKP